MIIKEFFRYIPFISILILFESCSNSDFWGEEAPSENPVELDSKSSEPVCPNVERIFNDPLYDGFKDLDCWQTEFNKMWGQVEGSEKDSLSEGEIHNLLRSKVFQIDPDPEKSVRQVSALIKLFGLNDGKIHRTDVQSWFKWMQTNLPSIRKVYQISSNGNGVLTQDDLIALADFFETFIRQAKWNKNVDIAFLRGELHDAFDLGEEYLEKLLILESLFSTEKNSVETILLNVAEWVRTESSNIIQVIQFFSSADRLSEERGLRMLQLGQSFLEIASLKQGTITRDFLRPLTELFRVSDFDHRRIVSGIYLLGMDQGPFVSQLKNRLQWINGNWSYLWANYKLIDDKQELNRTDLEEIVDLAKRAISAGQLNPRMFGSNFEYHVSRVAKLETEEKDKLKSVLRIINGYDNGIEEGNATFVEVLDSRITWIRNNWKLIWKSYDHLTAPIDILDGLKPDLWAPLGLSLMENLNWTKAYKASDLKADIFAVTAPTAESRTRINAITRLLDLSEQPAKEVFENRLTWVRDHFSPVVAFISALSNEGPIQYQTFAAALNSSAALLKELHWELDSNTLLNDLREIITFQSALFTQAPLESLAVGLSLAHFVCPDLTQPQHWQPQMLGQCFNNITSELDGGSDWINFYLNPDRPILEKSDVELLQASLNKTTPKLIKWFMNENLQPIQVDLWIKLATKMNALPPEGFKNSLKALTFVDSGTGPDSIAPSLMIKIAQILQAHHTAVLNGAYVFGSRQKTSGCNNIDAKTWKDCKIDLTKELIEKNPDFARAGQIYNPNFGQNLIPFSGKEYSRILMYTAFADNIIRAFDFDQNGLLTANNKSGRDEVLELIEAGIPFIEKYNEFSGNLIASIRNKPLPEIGSSLQDAEFNMTELARLVTLSGSEILVRRTPKRSFIFFSILENILHTFPRTAVHLDSEAIGSILYLLENLPEYRKAMLEQARLTDPNAVITYKGTEDHYFRRDAVINELPSYLEQFFPRTYDSCKEFAYGASCKIVFEEILPTSEREDQMIPDSDFDVLIIMATLIESLVDRCDKNLDSKLSYNLIDGNDELDCGFTRMGDAVSRLMGAGIIESEDTERYSRIISTLDSVFILRAFGKVPMIFGRRNATPINVIFRPHKRKASIGSILGLVADIIDEDAAKAARKAHGKNDDDKEEEDTTN